jgi:hypothetical protein
MIKLHDQITITSPTGQQKGMIQGKVSGFGFQA